MKGFQRNKTCGNVNNFAVLFITIIHITSNQINKQRLSWLKFSLENQKLRCISYFNAVSFSSIPGNEQPNQKIRDMIGRGTEQSLTINIICESFGWA